MEDPYLDPMWAILRNKVHARTQAELDVAEANLVAQRTRELIFDPIAPTFDLAHLQAIHRYLFQDVYPWAGELRTVNIHKPDDVGGGFFPYQRLRDGAHNTFAQLHDDNLLRGLGRDEFVDKFAVHLDQVNHLHPFREGNGRTQRVFFDQLAQTAGYRLDWAQVDRARNDHASRAANHGDSAPLRAMLDDIVVTAAAAAPQERSPDEAEALVHLSIDEDPDELHRRATYHHEGHQGPDQRQH